MLTVCMSELVPTDERLGAVGPVSNKTALEASYLSLPADNNVDGYIRRSRYCPSLLLGPCLCLQCLLCSRRSVKGMHQLPTS
jgi:hypothetical protein